MAINTPVNKLLVDGTPVYVKREDMFTPAIPFAYTGPNPNTNPPPVAKMRGLMVRLEQLAAAGKKTVGYMNTTISMGGWAVAYCAPFFDLHAVIFFPEHKDGLRLEVEHYAKQCTKLGAEVLYLTKPTQTSVNWYRARSIIDAEYNRGVLLPHGLPFDETVEGVATEVSTIPESAIGGTVVMAVGSGTMAAGVMTGLARYHRPQCVHGVLVSAGDIIKMKKQTIARVRHGLFKGGQWWNHLKLYWTGYEYTDTAEVNVPFPCNKYYDAKAWKYLCEGLPNLKQPILFWNIGA